MRYIALTLLLALAAVLHGADYSDAPATYGSPVMWGTNVIWLGPTATADAVNPVAPAWSGDSDDGVVGTPAWNSWSNFNSLTVSVSGVASQSGPGTDATGWLCLWVDANDNGVFESSELYEMMPGYLVPAGNNYTFDNIRIHATQNFSRNGANKVAVRVMVQENIGGPPIYTPNGFRYFGEVEDWLIDITPAALAVYDEVLREATETQPYNAQLRTVNGTGPYTWSHTGGALPQGLTLVQQGDFFVLSGTPAVGTSGDYVLDMQVTDATSAVAVRTITLEVTPAPFPLPFQESFSTNNHWKLGAGWAITQATGFVGYGASGLGYPCTEAPNDYTPGNSDDLMLISSPNADEPILRTKATFAVSPKINCANAAQVELRFRRWYSVVINNSQNNIKVDVTSDGANWTTVWVPPYHHSQAADINWSLIIIDLTTHAANKPWIRVRFRVGEHVKQDQGIIPVGFAGWGIDDVEVRQGALASPLVAHDMELQSTAQVQNSVTGLWYPLIYPQFAHVWEVKVDNPTAQAVTIHEIEGTTFVILQPGSIAWWDGPPYFAAADCWHDWGTWTLDQPVTIGAGATNVVVRGRFHFNSAPLQYLQILSDAQLYLRGTQAGSPRNVELIARTTYVPNGSPLPGVYVFETQAGSVQIMNGEAATGLRAFGSQGVGTSSGWQNIVIENTTSLPLNIGTPTLGGADAGEFQLFTSNLVNVIPANDWTWFAVRFRPTGMGARGATVEFTHAATNTGTPFTFGVSGVGTANAPIILVRETSVAGNTIGNGAPATGIRNFGQVDIGAGPTAARVIYIENTGTQALTLGTPALTGADAGAYSLDLAAYQPTLGPGASATFSFQFDPASTGTKQAAIEITHNDTGTADPFVINLLGEGIIAAPVIVVAEGALYGATIAPGAGAAGGRLFGQVDVGAGATLAIRVYIRNDGWMPLTMAAPTLTGANAADFLIDTAAFNTTLPALSSTWFELAFDPTAKGIKTARVTFTHNDSAVVSPFDFELRGFGVDANGVVITTTVLGHAKVGEAYAEQLGAAQGTQPYTWSLASGAVPAGLALDPTGAVAGTPSGLHGVFQFEVLVTDAAGGTESQVVHLTIQPPTGHLEKNVNGADGGGCAAAAGVHGAGWLLLAPLVLWRRRKSA
ncbi:MAG: choice-of-anchor D domain-containing protein [Planctomycetes bacterium]|nr:choice-of-anchor D domain-containing protein [Planctomycetota bacterium]